MFERAKCVWSVWNLTKGSIWPAALQCVRAVKERMELQRAAQVEPNISFCPFCGQRPQDDRRKDEARQLLVAMRPNERRRTIDAVLSLAYWVLYK